MNLTENDRQMRETVIEFASCLYGGAWRERLAEVSGMPKRAVIDYFRADKALPQSLSLSMLRAMQNDIEAQITEKQALWERVKTLRLELIARPTVAHISNSNGDKEEKDLKILASVKDPTIEKSDQSEADNQTEIPIKKPRPFAARRTNHRQPLRLVASRNFRD